MRRLWKHLLLLVLVGFAPVNLETVSALPIIVPLLEQDLADFDIAAPASLLITAPYDYNGIFTGTFNSQAFLLDDGDYLYLYQVANDGPSILEMIVLLPVPSLSGAGTVDEGEPAGFLAGGLDPIGATRDPDIPTTPMSFNYPSSVVPPRHIPAGEHSNLLYLLSNNGPADGEAHLIDGGVAAVPVVVPVPEPATATLLAIAAAALLRRRRGRA